MREYGHDFVSLVNGEICDSRKRFTHPIVAVEFSRSQVVDI